MQSILNKIYNYSLEDIMGSRFERYAKAIIQDRALPDVRDGLKPVQRRILYMMWDSGNTFDKPYRKSARVVGDVMGKLHPHGDSSIYDAMVRMSQWWKQNTTYIDMHGNNGSMDGDSAAAMRYTEARLSKVSSELLKDIKKDTVLMTLNYDDTEYEPTVLPAKFPNLLVNGSTGISAGYATNIPPHNLGEVIDATIKRIDSPNCNFDTIMNIIKGPDFPTGAIACGKNGIIEAFKTGKGRIIIKSKYEIVETKGKKQIVITEIPFEVNKALLVKKIDEIRIDKKIDGIIEVRDESDLNNPETIVIDIKKDADSNLIVNYLLKNTEMQISYSYNMVAIVNHRPVTLGIIDILDAYIKHLQEVIIKRTKFDLDRAKKEMHIVEGLIKALEILDDVIKTIRSSKNKSDAKDNLVKLYDFSIEQAEAIVTLQLYKLTNTDVTELIQRRDYLLNLINDLTEILNDESKLKSVMKEELRAVKKEYATDRKTIILDEVEDIKLDTTKMIPKEDCIVVVTNEGYIKRVSPRSYQKDENTMLKEKDYVIGLYEANTLDTILIFTNLGNYLYIPVHLIPELKWKELGKHVSNIIKLESDEAVVKSLLVSDFEEEKYITLFTKNGMVKRTKLSEFKAMRYSKSISCMKLKDNDEVISVVDNNFKNTFIVTEKGYALFYNTSEIPEVGLKASGVKSINLKDDKVVSAHIFDTSEYIVVVTKNGTGKRVKISEFEKTSRAKRGVLLVRDVKTNPYHILNTFITDNKNLSLIIKDDIQNIKTTELPIVDRYSTGTVLSKLGIDDAYITCNLTSKDIKQSIDIKEEIIDIELDKIDEEILTIDDFLDDFEI